MAARMKTKGEASVIPANVLVALAEMVGRHSCLHDSGDDGPGRYYRFRHGRRRSHARSIVDRYTATLDSDRDAAHVQRVAEMVAREESGTLWVEVLVEGSSTPLEYVSVECRGETLPDTRSPDVDDLGSGLARMVLGTNEQLRELLTETMAQLHRSNETISQLRIEGMELAITAATALQAAQGAQYEAIAETLRPAVEQGTPVLLSALLAWLAGSGGAPAAPPPDDAPTEPTERADWHIQRIVSDAQQLGALVAQHGPDVLSDQARATLDQLRQVLAAAG